MDKLNTLKNIEEHGTAKQIISQYLINLNEDSETIKNKFNAFLSENKKDAAV